jgi:hypothetical protein
MQVASARKTSLFASSALFLSALPSLAAPPSVLTQHNDNARTGSNSQETILTPSNVNVDGFGKLFTRTLDSMVNGQVLYVPNLTIQGVKHNVLFAYTANNDNNNSPCSVYAFDADDPGASSPLWRHQLPASAHWTTCTPVIDPATNTLYVLTKDTDNNGPTRLRALDLTTGSEKPGSPITIAASVPGTGDGSSNGVVSFDTTHNNCRPGLLFLNGVVYLGFAHATDSFPYHGWVFGYRYDQTGFTQTATFCTTPNGGLGGVWQAGKGIAADADGNLYFAVGNGTFNANSGGTSYGMCILRLSTPNLKVVDWFAPFDEAGQSAADLDTGSCGPVGIPGTNRLFVGGTKYAGAFLLDSTNLGHFTQIAPDKALQRLDVGSGSVGQNPISWDSGTMKYVYLWPPDVNAQQYRYDPGVGKLNPDGIYKQASDSNGGGSLAVTSNGIANGILWAVGLNGVVYAYDANDISKPAFWTSNQNANRDALPFAGKWQFPTIVNGKAYIPTGTASIAVYGLLPNIVSGAITLTGCDPAHRNQPLTLEFRPADGSGAFLRSITLNPDGSFALGGIAPKKYNLAIKGGKWLRRVIAVDTSGGNAAGVTANLLPGDINNDNIVTIADLGLLADAFNTTPSSGNWNANADLNCDGKVNIADLGLLADNFGRSGDP